MASKGKGKGKGIAKKFDLEPQKKLIAQYDGALDHNYFIEAHFENKYWKKARILECRLAKDYDTSKKRIESSYEYYIHYEGINRRMDEWVTFNRIRKTDEKVTEDDIRKKIKKGGKDP